MFQTFPLCIPVYEQSSQEKAETKNEPPHFSVLSVSPGKSSLWSLVAIISANHTSFRTLEVQPSKGNASLLLFYFLNNPERYWNTNHATSSIPITCIYTLIHAYLCTHIQTGTHKYMYIYTHTNAYIHDILTYKEITVNHSKLMSIEPRN